MSILLSSLLLILVSILHSCESDIDEPVNDPEEEPVEIEDTWDYQSQDEIINSNSKYLAVIGDIQEYTYSNKKLQYLIQTCDWLRSQQKHYNNFICVLQNGDLSWDNAQRQWNRADEAFYNLGSKLLLIPCTGNHDYTLGGPSGSMEITDRSSTLLNSMTSLTNLKRSNVIYYEDGKLDNIIVPVEVDNKTINIIALEFGPRKSVVSWTDSVIKANPDNKYVLMTHEWLTSAGKRISGGSYAAIQMPNLSHSSPEEVWQKLVYPNDNILCVLCGHNGFCKYLYSTNIAGREVCQILFNLQYQKNGGDGMIQLWEFPKDEDVINIKVYNTITREFHADPDTEMKILL